MTERRVIIDLDREATPDQMVTMQDGIEASIDHIVADALIPGTGYAGLAASFVGTVVSIAAGRLYSGGKVYASASVQTFDMVKFLPATTKKLVYIVASGVEQDTDVAQVNFLDPATSTPAAPVYKPQAVATTHSRLAVIQPAYGQEAPNPVAPDPGLALPVAVILLTPAGIASCVNIPANGVPVLTDVTRRTGALETFQGVVGPQVSSLASDLANLANSIRTNSSQGVINRVLLSIADLNAKVGIPSTAADSSADYLLDGSNSDLANPLSNCKVSEGIRYADDGAATAVLNLFNPFETLGSVKGGVLFPTYNRYLRRTTGPSTGNVQANTYTYNSVNYVQKTMTRTRTRYGTPFDVCTNSGFWQSGTYNALTSIFTLPNGETYKAAFDLQGLPYIYSGDGLAHIPIRLAQFWTDSVNETYWDGVVQVPQSIAGYHIAETELVGQDQWIDAVGFYIDKLDAQGSVTVLVCKALNTAQPDPNSVLAQVTLNYSQLTTGENVASLATPVLLKAGQRISYVIVTAGAHALQTTDGSNFPQGTFFVLAPSGYAQGDLTKHLRLNIYGCKFAQSTATIQLQNLQLAGGMTGIDILAGTIAPASTSLVYSIQLGGVLVPLNAKTVGQLNSGGSLPPNVPLYVTFSGTPDMMPALNLAQSQVNVSRPKISLAHVWPKNPRTPPVSTTQVRVIARYENYDAVNHTWGVKLLTGTGYATQTAPSSFTDVVNTNDNSLVRTYVFNLAAAITSYKVLTQGTAASPLKVGLGTYIKDYVL